MNTNMPSVILMTSDNDRHKYVANKLVEELDLVGIVCEGKGAGPSGSTAEENDIIAKHMAERDEKEREYFVGNSSFNIDSKDLKVVPRGEANGAEVFTWITDRKPDFVLLYGTAIIKPPLLDAYDGRMINMHLGLSPYYRGAGTNFWPLVNGEPECVGATIHLATLKVDAGNMLAQVRPIPAPTDRAHDIGCKAIISGVHVFAHSVKAYAAGTIEPSPQDLSIGKVFKKRDFNAPAVLDMWKNLESGMMAEYCADKDVRDARYPIKAI